MIVKKWVEMSDEVEVQVGADDISAALSEAFAKVPRDIDDRPNKHDVLVVLNSIGTFLRAFKDEHITQLTDAQRKTVREFLVTNGERFR